MKCLEFADQLEEQGYDDATVKEKVAAFRNQLMSKEVKLWGKRIAINHLFYGKKNKQNICL